MPQRRIHDCASRRSFVQHNRGQATPAFTPRCVSFSLIERAWSRRGTTLIPRSRRGASASSPDGSGGPLWDKGEDWSTGSAVYSHPCSLSVFFVGFCGFIRLQSCSSLLLPRFWLLRATSRHEPTASRWRCAFQGGSCHFVATCSAARQRACRRVRFVRSRIALSGPRRREQSRSFKNETQIHEHDRKPHSKPRSLRRSTACKRSGETHQVFKPTAGVENSFFA